MSLFFTGASSHFQTVFKSFGLPVINSSSKPIDNKSKVDFKTHDFETADNKHIRVSVAATFSRLNSISENTAESKKILFSNREKLPSQIEQCVQKIISNLIVRIMKSMMCDDILLVDFAFIDLLLSIITSELKQRSIKLHSIILKEVTIRDGPEGDEDIPILIDFNPDNHRESECIVWPADTRCLARVNVISTCPDETYVCIGREEDRTGFKGMYDAYRAEHVILNETRDGTGAVLSNESMISEETQALEEERTHESDQNNAGECHIKTEIQVQT